MGNLLVSLRNSASAMHVFEQGISIVQNNVTNSSTSGYARQSQVITANRFNLDTGLTGGVTSGGTIDSRNTYLEAAVRQQTSAYGYTDEKSQQLSTVETVFDITEGSGISSALSDFFNAFSALSTSPNDTSARSEVLSQAQALAGSINSVANGLDTAVSDSASQITSQVDSVNAIAGKIAALNQQFQSSYESQSDAGLQAQMFSLLENLSEVADFTTLKADDGTYSVYLGGQTALVLGNKQFAVSADVSNSPAKVLDAQGKDITSQISGGRLAGSLEIHNDVLPELQARLNSMAQAFADTVNSVLATGVDLNGNTPTKDLFSYDAGLGAARTLSATDISAAELAAASSASPGGNAVALQVAALADSKSIDGYSFSAYYGVIASSVGSLISANDDALTTASNLRTQAATLRDDAQSVNLNEEAISLIELQRGYQACSQLVKTLNEMTDTVLGMLN